MENAARQDASLPSDFITIKRHLFIQPAWLESRMASGFPPSTPRFVAAAHKLRATFQVQISCK